MARRFYSPVRLGLLLASIFLLQSCVAAALIGTAAAVGTSAVADPRTVGTQFDDEGLEYAVVKAIEKDEQIHSEGRVVAVAYNGNILLVGQVPSQNLVDIATSLARGVNGVSTIYNEIRIGKPISFTRTTQDTWITTKIKSQLLTNAVVKSAVVKVVTENGEVFLMGSVTPYQADAAAKLASQVNGVKKVIKVFSYLN